MHTWSHVAAPVPGRRPPMQQRCRQGYGPRSYRQISALGSENRRASELIRAVGLSATHRGIRSQRQRHAKPTRHCLKPVFSESKSLSRQWPPAARYRQPSIC